MRLRSSLLALALAAGCGDSRSMAERKDIVLEEIATLGSVAQMDGVRDQGQVRKIQEDTEKVLEHVREIWK